MLVIIVWEVLYQREVLNEYQVATTFSRFFLQNCNLLYLS